MCELCRRSFIRGAAALGAAGASGLPSTPLLPQARGGKLTAIDTGKAVAGAGRALAGGRERTKWR